MRSYELVTIFPTEEELFRQGKEAVSAEVTRQGGTVTKEDDMGERALAYPVKARPRGHYVLFNIELSPDKVIAAEKVFKLDTNILKYSFVRVEA